MGPTTTSVEALMATHAKPSERPRRGSLPELKTVEKANGEKKAPTGPRANPLYKTRLCMNFQSTGSCPYTDKCQFAHGLQELEQWEMWRKRNSIKLDDQKHGEPQSEPRSRSQSLEKFAAIDMFDLGSPHSSDSFDLMSTPIMSSVNSVLDESPCLRTDLSLWSAKLDEIDMVDRPFRPELRGRAATYDSTYDNMAQLSDAPTLFARPPVQGFGRLSLQ